MTRGSFEAWMKCLVCLWGVWCRLKDSASLWRVTAERGRERICAIWKQWHQGMHIRTELR